MAGAQFAALMGALQPPHGGNDAATSLLLPGYYSPGTSNIQDLSFLGRTPTINGTVTSVATGGPVRPNSLSFSGNSYLAIPPHASTNFGSGDFCIDLWVYQNNRNAPHMLFCQRQNSSVPQSILFYAAESGQLVVYATSNNSSWNILNGATFGSLPVGQWCHVAVYRNGSNFYGSTSGVPTLIGTSSAAIATSAYATIIGGDTNANYHSGALQEYRISKGASRFPATNFTPPVRPYT